MTTTKTSPPSQASPSQSPSRSASNSPQTLPPPVQLPPCMFPHTPTTYVLLFLFATQALLCLTDPASHPPPLRRCCTAPLHAFLLRVFRTTRALRLFFASTLLVHLLEAAFAARLIRRATHARAPLPRAAAWIAQTLLLGFPSLVLLMRLLAAETGSQHATDGNTPSANSQSANNEKED